MVATASTEHPIGCLRLARFPSKRNARNASDCVWMKTGLHAGQATFAFFDSVTFLHNIH